MKSGLKIAGIIILATFLYGALQGILNYYDPNAPISGNTRDYFVSQTTSQCSGQIQNTEYTADQINQYCSCTAEGLANFVTMSEAESVKNGNPISADLRAKLKTVAESCKQFL